MLVLCFKLAGEKNPGFKSRPGYFKEHTGQVAWIRGRVYFNGMCRTAIEKAARVEPSLEYL